MERIEDRPPTRREARRQDRRDAIVTVAAQSFLECGYAGTTMSAIAATLGGSKGTLWSYFPSKPELFAAVLDEVTIAFRARLSEILNPNGELRPTLARFCLGFMAKVTSPHAIALHRLIVAEAGRFPEIGQIFYERAPRATQRLLADFLAGAMERGQLRRDDPLIAARLLVNLCMASTHQELLLGLIEAATDERMETDVERALDIFMRAYAPI